MRHPSFVSPESRLDVKIWSGDIELPPQFEVLEFSGFLHAQQPHKESAFFVLVIVESSACLG